jgi:hypothetical protein
MDREDLHFKLQMEKEETSVEKVFMRKKQSKEKN